MIKITIGRNRDCSICFEGYSQVSSRHAELVISDDGRMTFTDYSTNGSYVNGQLVQHATVLVTYGCEIVFPGNAVLDWNHVAQIVRAQQQGGGYQEAPQQNSAPVENNGGGQVEKKPAAAVSTTATLSFTQTLSEGLSTGLRNCLSFIGAVILWVLTIWIPYINVGTTIAIVTLPLLYARGETFSPLLIFDSSYRRIIGNFMLLSVLRGSIIFASMLFMIIPSFVMLFSYLLAPFYLIEKDQNPLEAMQSSSRATYGSKWTILAVYVIYFIAAGFVMGLFGGLAAAVSGGGPAVGIIIGLVGLFVVIATYSVLFGIIGSIWNQLKNKTNY